MPSIWITSNPRSERSDPIHSFSRAADSATKRREAADFDRPEPLGAGTSPSGKRIERSNLRVETLISIWFMAHLPSQSSVIAPLAPAMRRPILATPMARTARRLRIDLHHLAKRLKPSRQAKPLEARRHARQ